MKTIDVLSKLQVLHQRKYEYDISVDEVLTKEKINVICSDHGVFTPTLHDHLYKSSGCPQCKYNQSRRSSFIDDAIKVHGNVYQYTDTLYVNNYTDVAIRCHTHGIFYQNPIVHLRSTIGCPQCKVDARTSCAEDFRNKAHYQHHNRYNYGKVEYVNSRTKVCIICNEHGPFMQTPDNHLKGAGCVKCAGDSRKGAYVAGLSAPDKLGILYIASFSNSKESFLKLGITSQKRLAYRYGQTHAGYRIISLHELKLPIRTANTIERRLLREFQRYKYRPDVKFGGYTECLDIDPNIVYSRTLNLISEYKNE